MSKTWDTKNKIIDLLSKKKMNLTELSKELDLAPSTVSQHINELLNAGAIQQVYNPFIIKLKYYEINPQFSGIEKVQTARRPSPNFMYRVIPIVVAVAVIAGLLLAAGSGLFTGTPITSGSTTTLAAQSAQVPTLFSISDSPTVSTVDAVNITVSSVMVHSVATGNWITVSNTPRSFNLVMLRNISALLGIVNLSAGTYNQLILSISNESAVVNNKTVSLFLPNSTIRIEGDFIVGSNGTAPSSVNVDIDLSKSLHLLGNGNAILLPTINLKAREGTNFTIAPNGIVNIRTPGVEKSSINGSEGVDGRFVAGNSHVPASAALKIGSDGKIELEQNRSSNTVVISAPDKAYFITNVTNVTDLSSNFTAWGRDQGFCNNHQCINVSTNLNCVLNGNSGSCRTGDDISAIVSPPASASINGTSISAEGGASAHSQDNAHSQVNSTANSAASQSADASSGGQSSHGNGGSGATSGIGKAIGHISTSSVSNVDVTATRVIEWD